MNKTVAITLCLTLPFLMTTLGALLIYFVKSFSKKLNIITIGLASGIMFSASIWSLLVPAIENSKVIWNNLFFIPIALGFVLGGIFMAILDLISSSLFKKEQDFNKEKAFRLFSAITIHNIPEGLSVGFAIGTAIASHSSTLIAFTFALGIAIQNFPEGLATALPIYSCLHNKTKAFTLGTLSGAVEPLFATIGFYLASSLVTILPWLLSLSSGAMIYVTIKELVPEIQTEGKFAWGTWFFIIGFVLMMLLDICF